MSFFPLFWRGEAGAIVKLTQMLFFLPFTSSSPHFCIISLRNFQVQPFNPLAAHCELLLHVCLRLKLEFFLLSLGGFSTKHFKFKRRQVENGIQCRSLACILRVSQLQL
jgi:hypothetical protein